MDRQKLCDEDCNHCDVLRAKNSKMVSAVLNALLDEFGPEVNRITNRFCPNLTCCSNCHIDDFCHVEGCPVVEQVDAFHQEQSSKGPSD